MIKSTSKMSISGTTFISAIVPPLLSPTCIPIASLLSAHPCEGREPLRRAGWEPARHRNFSSTALATILTTNGATKYCVNLSRRLAAVVVVVLLFRYARSKGRVGRHPQNVSHPQRQLRRRTWHAHRF